MTDKPNTHLYMPGIDGQASNRMPLAARTPSTTPPPTEDITAEAATPLVSFVIVNYKCSDKVAMAARSIQAHAELPVQTIVVDNSNDDSEYLRLTQALSGLPCQLVNARSNRGFGAGCNLGATHATGEFLFFLNPDAQLTANSLSTMLNTLRSEDKAGAVGCLVMNEGDVIESSHGDFIGLRRQLKWCKHVVVAALTKSSPQASQPGNTRQEAPQNARRTDYVTGAALLMRTSDFRALGGYDEAFFMYAEETDLQYRLLTQLHKHVMFEPRATVFHERGGTFSVKIERRCLLEEGCLRFVRKHHGTGYALLYKGLTLTAIMLELLAAPLYREYSFTDNVRFLKHVAKA